VRVASQSEIDQHSQDTTAPEKGDNGGEDGLGEPGDQGDSEGRPDGGGEQDDPEGHHPEKGGDDGHGESGGQDNFEGRPDGDDSQNDSDGFGPDSGGEDGPEYHKGTDDDVAVQDRNSGSNQGQSPDDQGPGDDGRSYGTAGDRPEGDHHGSGEPGMAMYGDDRQGGIDGDFGSYGDDHQGGIDGDFGSYGDDRQGGIDGDFAQPGDFGDSRYDGSEPMVASTGSYDGGDPMFFGPGPEGYDSGDPMFFGSGPDGFDKWGTEGEFLGPDFGPDMFAADGTFNEIFMPTLIEIFGPDSYIFEPVVLPWEEEIIDPDRSFNHRLAGDWATGYSIQLYGEWNTETLFLPVTHIDMIEDRLDSQRDFAGAFGGIWYSNTIEGNIVGGWVAQDGSAGLLTGELTGSYQADGTWQSNWVSLDTIQMEPAGTVTYVAGQPISEPGAMYYDAAAGRSFSAGGGSIMILNPDGGFIGGFMEAPDQNWGAFRGEINGTSTGTIDNNWRVSIESGTPLSGEFGGHQWMELLGSQWSGGRMYGKLAGAWMDLSVAVTGVTGGKIYGIYDPVDSNKIWDMVIGGAWMDTVKFLEMAGKIGGTTDLAALDKLNIPRFEVGRTNLSGNNGNLNVNMNDVIFFSYTAGQPPAIWATNNVSGNYAANPAVGDQVLLNGAGFSNVGFKVERWSGNPGDKWAATVHGDNGLVNGHVVDIKGGAAGTIDSPGAFSGTAAGAAQ